MDNETGYGLEKKFGCVKVSTLRSSPCTIHFLTVTDKLPHSYFMVIDGKS